MSRRPEPETLMNLALLESGIHARSKDYNKARELHLCRLYMYLCGTEEDPIKLETVKRETGLYQQSLKLHLEALEAIGYISTSSNNHRAVKGIEVLEPFTFTLSSSIPLLTNILYGNSVVIEEEGKGRRKSKTTKEGFTLEDIKDDDDWKRVEPILLKYFKPMQIDPSRFLAEVAIRKSYWRKFNDILDDKDVDFEEYCRWYRKEKYPRVKFNYGLFVLESMVAEFKEDTEPDSYLDVSRSLEENNHKADVEKADEWLVQFDKKGKGGGR